jgi:hypothetical protein
MMIMSRLHSSLLFLALLITVHAKDYFLEKFEDDSYKSRWVQSTAKSDLGEFKLSHGKFYGDAKKDLGKCCALSLRGSSCKASLVSSRYSNLGGCAFLRAFG